MRILKTIRGIDRKGRKITVKTGDTIHAVALDGAEFTDKVRGGFIQHDTLGNTYPAVVLTERSWTALDQLTKVPKRSHARRSR